MQGKLKLQLDDLRIESFVTTPGEKQKGTVFGEQCTCYTNCTCPGCPTCDASCNGTCGGTCDASCNGTCDASCNGTCYYSCDGTCGGSCGVGDSCYATCALYSGCTPYQCV
jgi:hypothetical protein